MTVDEDRLARWLKDGTPDPPIALLADDIVRRAARKQRVRTWVPALTAACVILAVALLVTGLNRRHGPGPADRSAAPTVAMTHSQHQTTPPHHRTGVLDPRPWKARILSRLVVQDNSLTASRGRLYAFEGDSERLVRLDPRTGRVVARTPFTVDPDPESQPGLANGLVWAVRDFGTHVSANHRFAVVGLNLDTLHVEAQTAFVQPDTLVRSADNELLISSGRHLFLNPAFPAEERKFTPAGEISDLALSPDGSTILELIGVQIDKTVSAQDVASKGFTSATDLGSGANGLQSTAHGFFVTTSTGMAAATQFFPNGYGNPHGLTYGGGGDDPEIHLSEGIAWAGGGDDLACIDESTGQVEARVDISHDEAGITGLTALNGRLYASYHGFGTDQFDGLIEMTPPKACGLR